VIRLSPEESGCNSQAGKSKGGNRTGIAIGTESFFDTSVIGKLSSNKFNFRFAISVLISDGKRITGCNEICVCEIIKCIQKFVISVVIIIILIVIVPIYNNIIGSS